ncbi:MAG: hypothetical protein F4X98_03260 [Gammaproteobacteria bacterium]|nr:hypothetical protein [Gammaproteobacteria bacterium]
MLHRPPHPRVGPARTAGVTLLEIALALAFAAVASAIALTFGLNLVRGIDVDTQSARTESEVTRLKSAIVSWYRGSYCRPGRPVYPSPPVEAPQFPLVGADVDLDEHRLTGVELPVLGIEEGAYDWEIDLDADNIVQFRVFWHYPSRFDDRIAVMARRFGGYCDDDDDAETEEPCDAEPAGERVVLPLSPSLGPVNDPTRRQRMEAWASVFGVECDANDDGRLDAFCDCGHHPCSRDGRIGPLDVNGDGVDDTGAYDGNLDGRLDFDLNGDLAVDYRDWDALGC